MTTFRLLFVALLITLMAYTAPVIAEHGLNLLPIFFGDIASMGWPGQFDFDFLTLLVLSATWTTWRNHFSPAGLLLAALALFFGGGFLTGYLLFLSFRHRGDIAATLLGSQRAGRPS